MNLVCGVSYDILVRMPSGRFLETTAEYCGGSLVDQDGNHVGFGMWSVGNKGHPMYNVHLDGHRQHVIPVPGSGRLCGKIWGTSEGKQIDDQGRDVA